MTLENSGSYSRRWSEQPNYKNREHYETAFNLLGSLRRSDQLCDVTIVGGSSPEERPEADCDSGVDMIEIPAHRVILAACSPYFNAMFTADMSESRQNRIYIQEIDSSALSMLIDYIYFPEIHITEENVQILLPAANLLQMSDISTACCEFLKAQLHPSNCLGIRQFADLHSCQDLLFYANAFTEQYFSELVQCDEFLSLSSSKVINLISSDHLTVASEEKVFESVIAWVKHEPDKRKNYLPNLMGFVRLPLLSQDYLMKIDSEPLIRDCAVCKDFLIEALKFHLLKPELRNFLESPRIKPRIPVGLPKLMIVIGGQAPKAIRNVDMYDFQDEKWKPLADLPARRCRCGVAVLNGLVYAIGGFNGNLRVRTVDVYDPARDIWSQIASMDARRSTLGVAVLNNAIFAVGGFDGSTGLNTVEVFDPRVEEWKMVTPMTTRRSSVGVGVLRGKLYAVGGYDGQSRQCLSTVERYDPSADSWTPIHDMTTRRSGAGVGVVDNLLYAVGGHDGPMVKKSAEVFDPQTESWRAVADMSLCRRNAGVLTLNGMLYAVGGDDGSSNLVSVEVYNSKSDTWTMLPSCMSIGRSYAGVAVINKASTVAQPVPATVGSTSSAMVAANVVPSQAIPTTSMMQQQPLL